MAIIHASFSAQNFKPEIVSAWLSFYVKAQRSAEAQRLLRVYHRRLHSNLAFDLRKLSNGDAEAIAHSLAALIDGLYIRQALREGAPDGAAAVAMILVSFEVVSALEIGQELTVVPSDGDATPLAATLTEIGRRAASVSSFPVVVTLDEARPDLRSGMAVEVLFDLPVPEAQDGIELPLSAVALGRDVGLDETPRRAQMFVARPIEDDRAELALVDVTVAAVAGSAVYVTDGLAPGELVVTAGVSFLDPGQIVRLPDMEPDNVAEVLK